MPSTQFRLPAEAGLDAASVRHTYNITLQNRLLVIIILSAITDTAEEF